MYAPKHVCGSYMKQGEWEIVGPASPFNSNFRDRITLDPDEVYVRVVWNCYDCNHWTDGFVTESIVKVGLDISAVPSHLHTGEDMRKEWNKMRK